MAEKTVSDNKVHFVVCSECGRHGYIAYGNGIKSAEIFCKKSAREIANEAKKEKLFVDEESENLEREIQNSNLVKDLPLYLQILLTAIFNSAQDVHVDVEIICTR